MFKPLIYKTFIAYANEDNEIAQLIHDSLSTIAELQPYKAENYPYFGEEFKQRIQAEIINSFFMVILLTKKGKTRQFVNQELGFAVATKIFNKVIKPKLDPNKDLPIIIPVSQKGARLKGFITKDSNDILFMDNYSNELLVANLILAIRNRIHNGIEGKTLTLKVSCENCSDQKNGLPTLYKLYLPEIAVFRKLISQNKPLKTICPKCKNLNFLDSCTNLPHKKPKSENSEISSLLDK
jgi:hypothetical protein